MSRSHMYLVAETTLYIVTLSAISFGNIAQRTILKISGFSLTMGTQG